jgi:hypothetical protein
VKLGQAGFSQLGAGMRGIEEPEAQRGLGTPDALGRDRSPE